MTKDMIDMRNRACESSWHFDYNGVNPSYDYVEKVMDPNFLQNHRPFHGFLDHYSQLLEMRDICRRNSKNAPQNSTGFHSPGSAATFDMSGSCHFTPRSQLSRSNSDETITSIKFEIDSQLDNCLHRLRYPSEEDLLEQKSHYMISYNMLNDFGTESIDSMSMISQPVSKPTKGEISRKLSAGYDLTRSISSESQESLTNDLGISMEYINNLASCEELNDFMAILDQMELSPGTLRLCEFSFDQVWQLIARNEKGPPNKRGDMSNRSPIGSIVSLQSGITIEDNILKDDRQLSVNVKIKPNSVSDKRVKTVGRSCEKFIFHLLLICEGMGHLIMALSITLVNVFHWNYLSSLSH